jgi:hypothetical protein
MKKLLLFLVLLTNFAFSQTCGYLPNLFISEVTDASLGGLTYVEIYNGTENPINLSGYNLKIYNNGGLTVTSTINLLSFTLQPQNTYIVALGTVSVPTASNTCLSVNGGNGSLANQTSFVGSINFTVGGSDCIRLCNGATVIDTFGTFGSGTWSNSLGVGIRGVDFRRKPSATLPSVNYINSDWDIINWVDSPTCSQDEYSNVGVYTFTILNPTTWDGTSWSNGIPTLRKLAIINGNYNTAVNGDIDACSLIVNPTFLLEITDSKYVKIENDLTNNGTVNVLNNGSLIQVNDNGVNTGNISYNRNVNSLYGYDYIYWSSPVIGQTFTNLYSMPTMGFIYQWNPTFSNTNGTQGNWESLTPTTPMTNGKGYIIRVSSSYGWTGNLTSVFTGVPNNGGIIIPIQRGNLSGQDDNYNLIGNPYPSAINSLKFLTFNTNIQGFVYLWTHGTAPSSTISSPFYSTFQYNYTSNDYITYNGTATTNGPTGFNGDIASGQGFFVVMNDGTTSTESVIFNNDMRNTNNSQFYRQNNQKSRIWIDLVDSNLQSSRTVIGYVDGATNNKDRLYDAVTTTSNKFYSLINNEPHIIQGRSLPFKKNDEVKLGINITTTGIYKIAIAEVDGVFNTRDIYLEDKLLNITYDLKSNPYTFTSNVGVFNDRFVLKYKTNNRNDNKVNNNIKKVSVYDMMGVKIFEGDNETYKNMVPVINHIYIVKTEMENGFIITKKVSGL